jgi:hypothetical protein
MKAWLQAQADALWSTINAVLTNKPAPARQVVIYMVVIIALAVVLPKVAKTLSK